MCVCACMAIGLGVVYLAVLLLSCSLCVCVCVGGRPFPPALLANAKCRIPARRDGASHGPPMLLAQLPPRPTRP